MIDPREEFKDLIRELAQEEVKDILKNEEFYRSHTGVIVEKLENDKYSVDIVTSVISDIYNKSGQDLSLGDTVVILEKYGSNFSDCFILTKTNNNNYPYANQADISSLVDRVQTLENKVQILENQLNGIYFSASSGNSSYLYATLANDPYKWLIIPDDYIRK